MPNVTPESIIAASPVVPRPTLIHSYRTGSLEYYNETLEYIDGDLTIGEVESEARIAVKTFGEYRAEYMQPDFADEYTLDIRPITNVSVTMAEPSFVQGLPTIPLCRVRNTLNVSVTGQFTDYQPFNNTDGQMWQWDGTTLDWNGDPYNLSEWEPRMGNLSWFSSGDYRPNVRLRRDIIEDYEEEETVQLQFRSRRVEHMWLDLGAGYSELTVIIVAKIGDYDGDNGHYLLDAGMETPQLDVSKGQDYRINDHLDYRAAIYVHADYMMCGASDKNSLRRGRHIRSGHNNQSVPRMYYATFNGDRSVLGAMSAGHKFRKHGDLSQPEIRYLVMGRKRNRVTNEAAADAVIYDVRIFDSKLSEKQIRHQYKQIKYQHKFAKRYSEAM